MENGVVRIHPVHGKNVLDSLTTYWLLHLHDSHYGAITAIRTSYDDKYVFTVGADGNFFVYNFVSDATLKESKPLLQSLIPKIKVQFALPSQPNIFTLQMIYFVSTTPSCRTSNIFKVYKIFCNSYWVFPITDSYW